MNSMARTKWALAERKRKRRKKKKSAGCVCVCVARSARALHFFSLSFFPNDIVVSAVP